MSETIYKPGYDGPRLSGRLSGPEKQTLREGKHLLVERLHAAMMTLTVQRTVGHSPVRAAGSPAYLVEFADKVGADEEALKREKFKPTAAQVSDMPAALQLMDGLTRPYFQVVMLRAMHEFSKEDGGQGDWPWKKIGERFGLSDRWAESAYDAAIVQAARRCGLLPMFPTDFAVLIAGCWVERGWLTHLATASDPKQALANLKTKSPVRPEQASTIWVAGEPIAKRLVSDLKAAHRGVKSHGAWYKAHPDSLLDMLVTRARQVGAAWMIEELPTKGAMAAADAESANV